MILSLIPTYTFLQCLHMIRKTQGPPPNKVVSVPSNGGNVGMNLHSGNSSHASSIAGRYPQNQNSNLVMVYAAAAAAAAAVNAAAKATATAKEIATTKSTVTAKATTTAHIHHKNSKKKKFIPLPSSYLFSPHVKLQQQQKQHQLLQVSEVAKVMGVAQWKPTNIILF